MLNAACSSFRKGSLGSRPGLDRADADSEAGEKGEDTGSSSARKAAHT